MSHKLYRLPDKPVGFQGLHIVEEPLPKLKVNEVLIKVHAVSLNYRDLIIARGEYPLPMRPGVIPCSDGAGEIVDVGADVETWQKGDRVAGIFNQGHLYGAAPDDVAVQKGLGGGIDGMLAQYRALPEDGIVRIPSHLTYEQAATLPCAAVTAWNALYGGQNPLLPGQAILVEGTGGVSVFALQLASHAGARVAITSSSDDKLKRVSNLGPNVVGICYKTKFQWDEEVKKTVGAVDHVVEVGGPGTLEKAFACTKRGGHIASIGFVAKGETPNVPVLCLQKSITFRGILIGSRQQFIDMNRHIETNKIVPVVDRVFPFEQAQQAYTYQWEQKHVGKVVIRVD